MPDLDANDDFVEKQVADFKASSESHLTLGSTLLLMGLFLTWYSFSDSDGILGYQVIFYGMVVAGLVELLRGLLDLRVARNLKRQAGK